MNNNKLITEFMGGEHPLAEVTHEAHHNYDTEWNWLMPVVDKIESLGYVFTIQGGKAEYGEMISETRCFIVEDKLSSTHKAVVEFIKAYNDDTF